MPDDTRPPHDPPAPPTPNTDKTDKTDNADDADDAQHVVISFLEHLAKRRPTAPAVTTSPTPAPDPAPPAADTDPSDTADADTADADTADADTPWPLDSKVVDLDEIRRLRQQAADAGLPDNPLLRYLFEHLMPSYHGGPVNLEVRPEFLQEHARPLLSLLLQSVADSLDRKRPADAAPAAPADASPAASAADAPADAPADASPTTPSAPTIEVKKSVAFNLDLSGIFRQLFSRKPPEGGP